MRLKSLELKNFRCFPDEKIEFDRFIAFVGANNAGKSVIFAALDTFFKSNPKNIPITLDDFYKRDTDRELKISLTFDKLSPEAEESFGHYVRSGDLTFFILSKFKAGQLVSSLHGTRYVNPDLAPFFEGDSAAEKKAFYNSIKDKYGFATWTSEKKATADIRAFESATPDKNKPIPSDDNAFGAEGPVARLKKFIEFVYVPAVKDAHEETTEARNTAFTRLINRAVRAQLKVDERLEKIRDEARTEIDVIAKEHANILEKLAQQLDQEYKKLNSSESKLLLQWGAFDDKNLQFNLPSIQLRITDDLITNALNRFGHGTQRNYLVALLIVSASYDFSELQTMIVACEEPELYQHPPQARVLAAALEALASDKTQVIITTHSPYFVSSSNFNSIRLVHRSRGDRSRAYSWSHDENRALIAKSKGEAKIGAKAAVAAIDQFLQPELNEMFFAQQLVLVEGIEDRAILTKYLRLTNRYQQFLRFGGHIVPTDGKGNLLNAIALARGFQIPYFVIFDSDMNSTQDQADNVVLNKNIFALIGFTGNGTDGKVLQNTYENNFCCWKNNIQAMLTEEVADWATNEVEICKEFGWTIARLRKKAMVLEATMDRSYKGKPIPALESLCSKMFSTFGITAVGAAGSS